MQLRIPFTHAEARPPVPRPVPAWRNPWAHSRPATLPQIEDRLWADAGRRMNAASLNDRRLLLVGFSSRQRGMLRDVLEELGLRRVAAAGTVKPLTDAEGLVAGFDGVIVDFDSFPDTEAGVDALLGLRAAVRGVAVVLCSATVKGDDLTGERAAICDATLRLPLTGDRLHAALRAAFENHAARQGAPA